MHTTAITLKEIITQYYRVKIEFFMIAQEVM